MRSFLWPILGLAVILIVVFLSIELQKEPAPPPVVEEVWTSDLYEDEMSEYMHMRTVRLLIKCMNKPITFTKIGSGVIGRDALGRAVVFTARHVVHCGMMGDEPAPVAVLVTMHDGQEFVATRDSLKPWGKGDVATLEPRKWISGGKDFWISPLSATEPVVIGDVTVEPGDTQSLPRYASITSRQPKIGEKVCYMGGAMNLDELLVQPKCGLVFRVDADGFWMTAFAYGGNSGGPIFDSEGNVIGIGVRMNINSASGGRGDHGMYAQHARNALLYPEPVAPKEDPKMEEPEVEPPAKPPEAVKPPPPAPIAKPDAGPLLQPRSLQERTKRTAEDLSAVAE
jgi:hypothetical protein